MQTLQTEGFDYLRPPVEVNAIHHEPGYVKSGYGENSTRRLFYGVSLDDFELSKISELEKNLARRGITMPPSWSDRETLRYIYGARFNIEEAINQMLECLLWRGNHNRNMVPDSAMRFLESGAVYTYGRDNFYRPIVIIDMNKINPENIDLESFEVALITLLDILKEYCFVAGSVENWIVLIDTGRKDLTRVSHHHLKHLFGVINACYPVTLERLFIMNASPSFISSWHQYESEFYRSQTPNTWIDLISSGTRNKVIILDPGRSSEILKFIPSQQLEYKFGGALPDLNKFWIPRVPLHPVTPQKPQNLHHSIEKLDKHLEILEERLSRTSPSSRGLSGTINLTNSNPVDTQLKKSYNLSSYDQFANTSAASGVTTNFGRTSASIESYNTTYFPHEHNIYSSGGIGLGRTSERVKKSALPVTSYEDTTTNLNWIAPTASVNYRDFHVEDHLKKRPYHTEPAELHSKDKKLMEMILNENNFIEHEKMTGKYEKPFLHALSHEPNAFGNYTTVPERPSQIQENIITKHSTLVGEESRKKSSPYRAGTASSFDNHLAGIYKDDHHASPVHRTLDEHSAYQATHGLKKSHTFGDDNDDIEEWKLRMKQRPIEDEDEGEDESNFCGICVSRKRKPTPYY